MFGSDRSVQRWKKNRIRRRLGVESLEARDTPTVSSIATSFNGTKINAGNTIWFSSVAKLSGLGSTPVTLHADDGMISFTAGTTKYQLLVPNQVMVITPGSTSASINFDAGDNDWDTSIPSAGTGNVFVSGLNFPVTSNLPGGIKNVTWEANFWSDTSGVTVNWQWGAAVYRSFSTDYNAVGVKPVDNNNLSIYKNGDKAGTPESFKSQVTGGATGDGKSFTGNLTGAKAVKASLGDGLSDYPYPSSNPLTSIAFNESAVLRAANLDVANGQFEVWYNDEHALALGVSAVTVKTASGITTTNYPVSQLTTNPGVVINPDVGTTATSGDQAGSDVSGRPLAPALFITDITSNPNSRSGDWQWGGQAYYPSAVFGTWKSFTRSVDNTTSTPTVTLVASTDPVKNNWSLGAGADTPPGVLANEGYGAEIRWDLNALQQRGVLIPGHNYRFYVMDHDGDQNKAGGDSGQASYQYFYPGTSTGGTATISGSVVIDQDQIGQDGYHVISTNDTPLGGVTVVLINEVDGTTYTMQSDKANGSFSFSVPNGSYTLKLDLSGTPYVDMVPVIGTESGVAGDAPDGTLNTAPSGAHVVSGITLNANDTAGGYVLGLYDTSGGG